VRMGGTRRLLYELGPQQPCRPLVAVLGLRFAICTMFDETYTAASREARLGVDNHLRGLVEALVQGVVDGVLMIVGLLEGPIKWHDEMKIDPNYRPTAPGTKPVWGDPARTTGSHKCGSNTVEKLRI